MKDTLWRCRDGRVLLVSEMATSHLMNSIAKIKRDNWRKRFLVRLELEVEIRKIKGAPLI